ncbi:MAG: RNA 2'-phosphotransferase [Thermoplasmata archaeon]|nr:MAG: RNA 2'-phosphotransferase [Thermoplasmata archaeon]HDN95864.1 RNA 2'-phosphotransferase [Thermoplasmatales archaeon]
MKNEEKIKLSKLMCYILRHAPWEFGIKPDKTGFVELHSLLSAVKEVYPWVTEKDVRIVAESDEKDRYEIKGNKIRARYGHSYSVILDHKEDKDSKILYHGTAYKNLEGILKEGIKPMKRQFVHLTINKEDAHRTALRHDKKVVILLIDADCLRKKDLKIYRAGRIVRLVKYVPPDCIKYP